MQDTRDAGCPAWGAIPYTAAPSRLRRMRPSACVMSAGGVSAPVHWLRLITMILRLTSSDRLRVESALSALLSPLDATLDAWRAGVCHRLAELFDAPGVAFALDAEGAAPFVLHQIPPSMVETYVARFAGDDEGIAMWRETGLPVMSLETLLAGPGNDRYHRSRAYNEFYRPHQLADVLAMASDTRMGSFISVFHPRRGTRRFGAWGAGVLRLLQPALAAGLDVHARLAQARSRFTHLLDALGEPLRLCDAEGRVLHVTPSLSTLLAGDPESPRLAAVLEQVARSLATLLRKPAPTRPDPAGMLHAVEVRTCRSAYRVQGSLLPASLAAEGPALLVAVTRVAPEEYDDRELEERWGLTPRECQVARLMAQRRTNKEIARTLQISPHTAERHSERVLAKLRLASRTGVHARLQVPPQGASAIQAPDRGAAG